MADVEKSMLMRYLFKHNSLYHAKAIELREIIVDWLSYIPQTFPHYTRHTIGHSDEIVFNISKILFENEEDLRPVISLSTTEIYIIVSSAYLHDSGMVVSDQEKISVLNSEGWTDWTHNGDAKNRWDEILLLRKSNGMAAEIRNFICDLQTRYLLAEFIRKQHHYRTLNFMIQNQSLLGRFAFDDPILLQTISNVCLAHGLDHHELDNEERFPERSDIRNDQVNVKFMAILLRIGDLLDMSHERACPLLLNAACPLPSDSIAHWRQYLRIKRKSFTPDEIVVRAECESQEEHKFLQDWLQWLTDEVNQATVIMARSKRHSEWKAPKISINGDNPTISVKPSNSASYIPSEWKFELDHNAILQRMIHDVYQNANEFIRELLQNSFDATRCKMFEQLKEQGEDLHMYPTEVDEEVRNKYPIKIGIQERDFYNEISQQMEKKQVLTIEDFGIGMDKNIINKYFLQVGKSYYDSEEFRREFNFYATSQFGVGFLSVFAVSDNIKVETYKTSSADGAIQLNLSGPRNYLLTDKSMRKNSGTKIEIILRNSFKVGELTEIVRTWCKRIEFPIIVTDFNDITTITSEKPDELYKEVPDVIHENAKFIIRIFHIKEQGVEGEIYIFSYINDEGEHWNKHRWAKYSYLEKHPLAELPEIPDSLVCFHGIMTQDRDYRSNHSSFSSRIDLRENKYKPVLSRQFISVNNEQDKVSTIINEFLSKIVENHIKKSPIVKKTGWTYVQSLIDYYPQLPLWNTYDKAIKYYIKGKQKVTSLHKLNSQKKIVLLLNGEEGIFRSSVHSKKFPINSFNVATITENEIKYLSDEHMSALIEKRIISKIDYIENYIFSVEFLLSEEDSFHGMPSKDRLFLVDITDEKIIGHEVLKYSGYKHLGVVNKNNLFVQWFMRIKEIEEYRNIYEKVISLLMHPLKYTGSELEKLNTFLQNWDSSNLLQTHEPPLKTLTKDMFYPPNYYENSLQNRYKHYKNTTT